MCVLLGRVKLIWRYHGECPHGSFHGRSHDREICVDVYFRVVIRGVSFGVSLESGIGVIYESSEISMTLVKEND